MKTKYLLQDMPDGSTNSFLVGNVVVPAPSYIPEIKGAEDIQVLLKHSHALPVENPIMVPSNRWSTDIEKPIFRKGNLLKGIPPIEQFLKQHPFLFYDPPEFFRYTLGKNIVTYALKGSNSEARKFNNFLRKGKVKEALNLTDPFFHAFIERQLHSICSDIKIDPIIYDGMRKSHVEEAWFDERVDNAYATYISTIASDALKYPNATIIPPVPPLMKSSGTATIQRIIGSNAIASLTCSSLSESRKEAFLPYFHLYLDWGLIELSKGNDISTVLDLLQEGLSKWSFSGVAVTINGYEKAASGGKMRQLGVLINEIVNISHENYLPVILPRSKWYGLYFTDFNTQAFGSLLNGNLIYTKGGGFGNPENIFGKVPLIDKCVEMNFSDVRRHIQEYGEFPHVQGLPRKPTPDDYLSSNSYRLNWGKAMRLIHVEEARRLRVGKSKGIFNPAELYLNRSHNSELNAL